MLVLGALGAVHAACSSPNAPTADEAARGQASSQPSARPFDVTHSRIAYRSGDRLTAEIGGIANPGTFPIGSRPRVRPPADWNYNVGGPVTGGTAAYVTTWKTTDTASCSDMLYVPVAASTANVWAFTNLYATSSTGAACTNGPAGPTTCTASTGHCPTVAWNATLKGTLNRDSLTLSLDGRYLYAVTDAGYVYALHTAAFDAGTAGTVAWSLNANTGGTASFIGAAPWVDYATGHIYVAASMSTNAISLYKLSSAGAVLGQLTIAGDGIASGAVYYSGFVYLASTSGKIHEVQDSVSADGGTKLTEVVTASKWPAVLTAEDYVSSTNTSEVAVSGKPIYGTPAIDGTNNLLFTAVNNVMWSINLGGTSDGTTHSVELGWSNGTEAHLGDQSCYTSPMVYFDGTTNPATPTVVIAHGKNQGAGNEGPRLHRRTYQSTGVFDTGNLTSVAAGTCANPNSCTAAELTWPRSSPLMFQPTASSPIYAFVGDNTGTLERWQYTSAAAFTNESTFVITGSGTLSIESPVLIDYVNGNIYFGSDNGRVYQISQSTLQ